MDSRKKAVRGGKPVSRPVTHAGAQKRNHRKKRRSIAPALVALAFCLLALIPVGMTLLHGGAPGRSDFMGEAASDPVITLAPQPTAPPTEVPTPEPTPEPTVEPTPEPTSTPFAYLPVIHRAQSASAKRIAVTVDDCYQLNNLKTIVQVAEDNGAKLTLFPVGENVVRDGMSQVLRHSAFDLGFEIENHTWSHARIFRLPEDEMAREIWKQSAAVNQALAVNYRQHFLRLMGGDGDTDQRTHNYLKQLGYLGIANWSVSGSDSDMAHIQSALAPGQVYLFHTTDSDTGKLEKFIPWAISQGYELVTLNELLGLPDNEISPLTDQEMPEPAGFEDDRHTIGLEEYTWTTLQLQEVLRAEGYLVFEGPSTGYYGERTSAAVSAYQKDHGLPVTGTADEATQRMILGQA